MYVSDEKEKGVYHYVKWFK